MNGYIPEPENNELPMNDLGKYINAIEISDDIDEETAKEIKPSCSIDPTGVSKQTVVKNRNYYQNVIKLVNAVLKTEIETEKIESIPIVEILDPPKDIMNPKKFECINLLKFRELKKEFKLHFTIPSCFDDPSGRKSRPIYVNCIKSQRINLDGFKNIHPIDAFSTGFKNTNSYLKDRTYDKHVPQHVLKAIEKLSESCYKSIDDFFDHATKDILFKVEPRYFNDVANKIFSIEEFRGIILSNAKKMVSLIHKKGCIEKYSFLSAKLFKYVYINSSNNQYLSLILKKIIKTIHETVKYATGDKSELNLDCDEVEWNLDLGLDECQFHRRFIGNIVFSSFLIKHDIIHIMHVKTILDLFINVKDVMEKHLEYLVLMITISGKKIAGLQNYYNEKCTDPLYLDDYIVKIDALSKEIELSPKVSSLISDLISLKNRNWEPKINSEVNQDFSSHKKKMFMEDRKSNSEFRGNRHCFNNHNKIIKKALEKSLNPFAMNRDKNSSSFERSKKPIKIKNKSGKLTIGEYCLDIQDYVSNNIEFTSIMNICKGIPPAYLKEIFETIITKYLEDSKVTPVKMVTELFIQLKPSLNFKSSDIMSCLQIIFKEIHDTISDCPNIVKHLAYIINFAEKVLTNNQINKLFKCVEEDFRREFFLQMIKYLKEDLELYITLKKVICSAIRILTLKKFIDLLVDNSLFEVILFSIIWNLCELSKNITTQLIDHVKNNSFERYSGLIGNRLHSKLPAYTTTNVKKILSVDSKLLYALVRIISDISTYPQMAQMPNSSYTGVNQSNNGNINANYVMNGFPHQSTIAQLPMRDPNEPIKKLRFFNEQGVDVMEEVRKNNDVKKDIKKVEKKEIQFNITPTTVSDETLKSRNNFKNLIKKLALSVSTNINVENEAVKEPIKDVEHVEKIQVVKEPEKVLELIKIEFIDWSKFIELKNTFKQHFILPAFFDRYLYMKAGEMLEKYKSSHSIRHREGVRNIYRTDSLTTDYKNSFAY
ncbi:hypothetical protein A3Q56_07406, partial [Intoshia linei]